MENITIDIGGFHHDLPESLSRIEGIRGSVWDDHGGTHNPILAYRFKHFEQSVERAMTGRFARLLERDRRTVNFLLDGQSATAFADDTLLTALLTTRGHVRRSEYGDGNRAGFCLMGACQDCWVWTEDGQRLRACTTGVADGMRILTEPNEAAWPVDR